METTTKEKIYPPGTAIKGGPGGRKGYIIRSWEPENKQMIIGAHGMQDITRNYRVFYPSTNHAPSHFSEIDNNTIAEDVAEAERCEIRNLNENEVKMLEFEGINEEEKRREEMKKAQDAIQQKRDSFRAEFDSKKPSWAKAVIFAEFHRDDCDYGSDYFNTKTERVIILAWSKHKRDLFPEMRKAALNHPETAFLHDTDEKAEHRNKYSMGGGYFLSECGEYRTGWRIKKRAIDGHGYGIPTEGEWSLPENTKTPPKTPQKSKSGIYPHQHTQTGQEMFIVLIPYALERDEFLKLKRECKAAGGWYSRKWGTTPSGFAFDDQASAEAFQAQHFGESTEPTPPPKGGGDKLREMGESMQKDIDSFFADRTENTPKQQKQAGMARLRGREAQRAQKAFYKLAELADKGGVTGPLSTFTTKKSVLEAVRCETDSSRCGYYGIPQELDEPAIKTPANLALWELLGKRSEEDIKAEELKQKLIYVKNASIPGYFPTPPAVVSLMLDYAQIGKLQSVCEPSAGSGAILDAIEERHPDRGATYIFEVNRTLVDILLKKGYSPTGYDFMEAFGYKFDRIVMNPPFERLQDIDHVLKAYELLKPGGRIVSIMSPSPFFNSQKKASDFREWFENVGGEAHDLPEGSFKESGAMVNSKIVVIDKEG